MTDTHKKLNAKQVLGQFFTVNAKKILKRFESIVKGKRITDPFAGNGDLLRWAAKHEAESVKGFDISSDYAGRNNIRLRNSIEKPVRAPFILTNPPFLHISKLNGAAGKRNYPDLYMESLNSLMDTEEGICIVPINFLSSANSHKIRRKFFSKFRIDYAEFWECGIFPDTEINTVIFHYCLKEVIHNSFSFRAVIHRKRKQRETIQPVKLTLNENTGWRIGGNWLARLENARNSLTIETVNNPIIPEGKEEAVFWLNSPNNKVIKKIDRESEEWREYSGNRLIAYTTDTYKLKFGIYTPEMLGIDGFIGSGGERVMYALRIKELSAEEQLILLAKVNRFLSEGRKQYKSLQFNCFQSGGRKRIEFRTLKKVINYVYEKEMKNGASEKAA